MPRTAARPRRPQLTAATHRALFILGAAADAGFEFKAAGAGQLQVMGPTGVDPRLCEETITEIRKHGAEILRLIKWLDREADQGRFWTPRPEPRTPQ